MLCGRLGTRGYVIAPLGGIAVGPVCASRAACDARRRAWHARFVRGRVAYGPPAQLRMAVKS